MQFFMLEEEPTTEPEHQIASMDAVKAAGKNVGDARRSEACGKYVGMCEWLPPYRVELETWGRVFGDVAVCGSDLLVSSRFKQAWEQSQLHGLSGFSAVEIVKVIRRRKSTGAPLKYFRAVVSRGRTAIDLAASGFEWGSAPTCPACRLGHIIKRWKRILIDQATWNGDDIFIARGLPSTIIVSERFKEFCKLNDVKNAHLIPADTFARDYYPWEHDASPSRSSES